MIRGVKRGTLLTFPTRRQDSVPLHNDELLERDRDLLLPRLADQTLERLTRERIDAGWIDYRDETEDMES